MILACAAEVRREDPGHSDSAEKMALCQARVCEAPPSSFHSCPCRTGRAKKQSAADARVTSLARLMKVICITV
jgi:hypothetical protein